MSTSSFFHLIGRKHMGRLCALTAAMFIGALLEMLGISLVATVCSLMVDQQRLAASTVVRLFSAWTGIQPGKPLLVAIVIALIALYLFKMIYLLLEKRALARFVCGVQHEISSELFEGILHAPYAWFIKTSAADVMNLLNTDTGRVGGYLDSFLQAVSEGLALLTISALLVMINPLMTLFVLFGIGLSFLLTRCVIKPRAYRAGQTRRKANIQRMKWLNQGVYGIKDVKVAQSEDFFKACFDRENGTVTDSDAVNRLLSKAPSLCIEAIMVVCVLLYILFLLLFGENVLDFLPSLSALVVAALRLLPTTSHINACLTNINNTKPSAESVAAALARVREQKNTAKRAAPQKQIKLAECVTASGVTFSYEGRPEPVLRDVDVEVPAGSTVGIIGPSGAGKTTLVDILLGLLDPQKGAVQADGVDIRDCRESYLRQTAYIPQSIFLLNDTVRNNVAFGVPREQIDDGELWSALEKAALAGFVKKLPDGLDTLVGENGIRLSGGERQRLGIARALYQKCKLLVFDEATSALDPETERAIIGAVHRLRGEHTMVIISHRPSAVQDCDRIYRVEDGGVVRIFEDRTGNIP